MVPVLSPGLAFVGEESGLAQGTSMPVSVGSSPAFVLGQSASLLSVCFLYVLQVDQMTCIIPWSLQTRSPVVTPQELVSRGTEKPCPSTLRNCPALSLSSLAVGLGSLNRSLFLAHSQSVSCPWAYLVLCSCQLLVCQSRKGLLLCSHKEWPPGPPLSLASGGSPGK